MTRSAAAKAEEAADELLDWLSRQRAVSRRADPGPGASHDLSAGQHGEIERPDTESAGSTSSRTPSEYGVVAEALSSEKIGHATPLRLANTDWLHHRLTVSGPAPDVTRFRQAAAGAGIIPWHFDLDRMEEEYFHLLVSPEQRSVTVAGARIFARKLRDAVGRRHEVAVSRVGQSKACPFDLHALVPVPPEVLALGPDESEARAWLCTNWGTTEPLRHVTIDESVFWTDGDKKGEKLGRLRIRFWSADWTPWRALKTIQSGAPTLSFDCRPSYDPA